MDAISRTQRIHQRTLERIAGEWVEYSDGDLSIRFRAVRAKADQANAAGESDNILHADQIEWLWLSEYLVSVDDETEEKTLIEPRPGATIIPDDEDATYEVTNGPSGECFRYSDARSIRMRVFTDRITTNA